MNSRGSPREDTAARQRLLGGLLALGLALGCVVSLEPPEVDDAGSSPPAPGALRVRLLFGEQADLDLYVTDPQLETVYFANTPVRSGGSIGPDQRCESPAPRIEQVDFPKALAGSYRIGVDFPRRCTLRVTTVPYLVIVDDGRRRVEHRGEIDFARFQPRVLDFDFPGSASGPRQRIHPGRHPERRQSSSSSSSR